MDLRDISRGLKSFARRPLASLLLVFLLAVCLTFALTMLAVRMSAEDRLEEVKSRVGNYGELRVSSSYRMQVFEEERAKSQAQRSREARTMGEEEMQAERTRFLVPEDIADSFSALPEVSAYDKVITAQIKFPELTNSEIMSLEALRRGIQAQSYANYFLVEGNTDGASAADFAGGYKRLVEGSFFTYADHLNSNPVAMVEKSVAEENGLGLGD
ncbi:MAG: hypothetical protein WHT46_07625, partial [Candidatus Geothermincolales bacterium]